MRTIIVVLFLFSIVDLQSQHIVWDETFLDSSFKDFKEKLQNAIANKDSVKLESLLADEIDNGMKDYYSKSEFFNYHHDLNAEFDIWDKLNKTVKYGFHRGYRETLESLSDTLKFTAPSYLKSINTERIKGKNRITILSENLNVREYPNLNSSIITKISYGLYEPSFDKNDKILTVISSDKIEWIKIRLPNEKYGFVAKKYTSEYLYYTLVISKIKGEWKITAFYGDTRYW